MKLYWISCKTLAFHPLASLNLTVIYLKDTKLYIFFPIQDCAKSVSDINSDILRIRNWCLNNRLLMNPDKTQLMLYGSFQTLSNLPDVCLSLLRNDPIPAKAVKDLSVTLDPNLIFYDHILKIVLSCMSRNNTRKFGNVTMKVPNLDVTSLSKDLWRFLFASVI